MLPDGISPNMLPKHRKREGNLLIVGSARCVWDDLEKVWPWNQDVMCVNDMIMHYPKPVNHAYSNDHHWLHKWVAARRPRYVKDWGNPEQHTCQIGVNGATIWPWPGHGTSSLNAVYTGLALGYEQIVIAGVPLDNNGHYFDAPWTETNFEKEVADRDGEPKFWSHAAKTVFEGRVKSLSGRTKRLLDEAR